MIIIFTSVIYKCMEQNIKKWLFKLKPENKNRNHVVCVISVHSSEAQYNHIP